MEGFQKKGLYTSVNDSHLQMPWLFQSRAIGGYDWSFQLKKAITNFGSNGLSSKASFKFIKFRLYGYQMGLESLEARIVVHEKNEAIYEESLSRGFDWFMFRLHISEEVLKEVKLLRKWCYSVVPVESGLLKQCRTQMSPGFDLHVATQIVTAGNQTNKNVGIKDNVDARVIIPTQHLYSATILYDSPQQPRKDAVVDDAGKKD
ncbi:hypothetical protein Tco_0857690 [Tanacetum coccineum]|uniref:Uncharacterized protein n=1 Tax=Tanacetum coccineum TaxID=301880 RepID=A0ABQ5BA07_9ASTR